MPPPKKQAEQDPNRARTRASNANTHPGIAAKNALRARNPPRDPDIIQKERDNKEAKKIEKQKLHEEMQEREESATHVVKEYRARKDTEALNDNMPRRKPKKGQYQSTLETTINSFLILYTANEDTPQGPRQNRESESMKANTNNAQAAKASEGDDNRGTKITSNTTPKAVEPAQKQGTKRKTNDQLETERDNSKSISIPPKKAKTTKEALPKSTSARRPAAVPSSTSKSSKKRSSPTDNEDVATAPQDPKTPAPPLKKPRVNENDDAHKGKMRKSQPLRRSGIVNLILKSANKH